MSSNPQERPTPEHTDWHARSGCLRFAAKPKRKARSERWSSPSPARRFPWLRRETGYYGVPLLKEPPWTLGDSAVLLRRRRGRIGGGSGRRIAHWTGRDRKLARDCRLHRCRGHGGLQRVADLGPGTACALSRDDAGLQAAEPHVVGRMDAGGIRHIFRRLQLSPRLLAERYDWLPVRVLGNLSRKRISAAAGLPFSNYTGVLIGATAIPVWNENVGSPADSLRHVGTELGGCRFSNCWATKTQRSIRLAWALRLSRRWKASTSRPNRSR